MSELDRTFKLHEVIIHKALFYTEGAKKDVGELYAPIEDALSLIREAINKPQSDIDTLQDIQNILSDLDDKE